jgi:isopenicillin N synthase-like dioxygenase
MFRPVDNLGGPPYEVGLGENQWPQTPETFRKVSKDYIDAVVSLATEVVRAIAIGLQVDEKVLLSRVDKSFWNLRIIGYEATKEYTDTSKVSGIGEHTGNLCCCSFALELTQLTTIQTSAF